MARQTKILKLRGSIHDVQYLFAGIRAILLLKAPAEKGEVVAGVRKEISEYKPFLEYIKKFAEDRQREEREKEKWK